MGNPSRQEPVFGIDAMLLWWPDLEQGLSGAPKGISDLDARPLLPGPTLDPTEV